MILDNKQNIDQKKLLEYYFDQRKFYTDLLHEIVTIESPSQDPETVLEVLKYIGKVLEGLDCELDLTLGDFTGGYLKANPKQSQSSEGHQLLIGHTDTVWPVGTLKKMPAEISGDNVFHGPGIFDMKAGVVSMIMSIKAMRDLKIEPLYQPIYLFTSDEEIGSPESRNIIETIAETSKRAFVLEPALGPDGKIKTQRKGVGHFDITVTGKAAHAGLDPEQGASAILGLSHVIQELFSLNNVEKGISVNVGTVDGGLRSNVIAPECQASVDVRVMTWADAEYIEERIYGLESSVEGVSLKISGHVDRMPMEFTDRNNELWQKARTIGESIGINLDQGLSGGASDGNFTSQLTATLDGLGAVGDGAHADHEHILIDETIKRCALLSLLVLSD